MATRFIDPLFHSFYYMQYVHLNWALLHADHRLNVYYIMLEKVQSFGDGKYDFTRTDIENIYFEQRGEAGEQLEEMSITKRMASTGKLCAWTEPDVQPNFYKTLEYEAEVPAVLPVPPR
jgi:amphiphysin